LRPTGLAARTLFCCAALLAAVPSSVADGQSVVRLSPAHTRVGLAKVILNVSELTFEKDALVGSYEVLVPLAPWRNDRGEVRLKLDGPLDEIMASGGSVEGSGHSLEDGRTLPIVCRFLGGGRVSITVDNGDRILDFRSRVE